MSRLHFTFDCEGSQSLGTLDEAGAASGLLLVTGGNEVRSGAFSGQAQLAARIAAQGYPEAPVTGGVITGLAEADALSGVDVLHAGTRTGTGTGTDSGSDSGTFVASGGRVLSVVGRAATLAGARERAYAGVAHIDLPGSHHRSDIAAGR